MFVLVICFAFGFARLHYVSCAQIWLCEWFVTILILPFFSLGRSFWSYSGLNWILVIERCSVISLFQDVPTLKWIPVSCSWKIKCARKGKWKALKQRIDNSMVKQKLKAKSNITQSTTQVTQHWTVFIKELVYEVYIIISYGFVQSA